LIGSETVGYFRQSQNALLIRAKPKQKPQHNMTYTGGIVYPSAMQTDGR